MSDGLAAGPRRQYNVPTIPNFLTGAGVGANRRCEGCFPTCTGFSLGSHCRSYDPSIDPPQGPGDGVRGCRPAPLRVARQRR